MSNDTGALRTQFTAAVIREPGAVITLPEAVRFRVPGFSVYAFAVLTARGVAIERYDRLTGRRALRLLDTDDMEIGEQAAREDLIAYLLTIGA